MSSAVSIRCSARSPLACEEEEAAELCGECCEVLVGLLL